MNEEIRKLLLKLTDFRQEVTDIERLFAANEISRLHGVLAEAQGAVNFATLQIAQPNGSRFN